MLETSKLEIGGVYQATSKSVAMIHRPDQFKQKQIEAALEGERQLNSVLDISVGETAMIVVLETFDHYGPNVCVQLLTTNGILWQEISEEEEFFLAWTPLSKVLKDE